MVHCGQNSECALHLELRMCAHHKCVIGNSSSSLGAAMLRENIGLQMRKALANSGASQGVTVQIAESRVSVFVRRTSGAAERALLYVHGWGGSSRYWHDTMAALADVGIGIAPDLPGFGQSPPLADEDLYTHRGYAAILAALLDALNVPVCDVIAHSYGCGPAIHLAHAEPQRVRRLVLCNFSTFRSERERRFVAWMHRLSGLTLQMRRFKAARSRAFAAILGRQFFRRLPDERVLLGGLEDFLAMDECAAHVTVASSLGWDTHRALSELMQTVLLIHSRNDRIMPPGNADYTVSLAARGRLCWIDECGHMPMVEKPGQFCKEVRKWLEEESRS